VEKVSTEIARGYDLIRIEDLNVAGMTRSARGPSRSPVATLVRRQA
jgi:putative transposase